MHYCLITQGHAMVMQKYVGRVKQEQLVRQCPTLLDHLDHFEVNFALGQYLWTH